LEKVVVEFRKLFDDKTSFMAIYASSNSVANKKDEANNHYPHTHKPEVNKKSQKLDTRYFSQTMLKKMENTKTAINQADLKDRKLRLYNYSKYLIDKRNTILENKLQEEMVPCTFAPAITPYKKQQPLLNQSKMNETTNGGQASPSPKKRGYFSQALEEKPDTKRHLLLYEVAHQYREKLHQKAYALKKKEEIQELSHCTFEPRLNHEYEESSMRGQDFYEGVPKGFKRVVERLNKGVHKNKTLQTALSKIPRGENYEKNKNAPFTPPTQLSRPKIQRKEVLVYVDVSIGHGRTGRIGIHKGDSAKMLAQHFARTYSLNSNMRESLEKLLQSYIDSYFAQSPTNEQVDQLGENKKKNSHRQGYREEDEEEYDEEEEEYNGVEEVDEEEEEEDDEDDEEEEEEEGNN